MTASGPIFNHLLKFAAIAFLATSAFSQAPPKYDPATETKFKGVVQELKFVPPSGGEARRLSGAEEQSGCRRSLSLSQEIPRRHGHRIQGRTTRLKSPAPR